MPWCHPHGTMSCAQGGFSERKSLLFHPKSASRPLQGQVLAQQNVLVGQRGNSQHGVGKGKTDGCGAAWHGEPGSCDPSEQGSLTGKESSHQNPGRSLLSPSKFPPSCASLCHPPSSQLLPPPRLSLLPPQNVPTESKTLRKTPQHSNPPPHTSPASSPAPALPPSHHMQAAAMARPPPAAEPEIWWAWGDASFGGAGASVLAKNMSHVLVF